MNTPKLSVITIGVLSLIFSCAKSTEGEPPGNSGGDTIPETVYKILNPDEIQYISGYLKSNIELSHSVQEPTKKVNEVDEAYFLKPVESTYLQALKTEIWTLWAKANEPPVENVTNC